MSDTKTINTYFSYIGAFLACWGLLLIATSSSAQTDFVSPGVNTNLIGVTPDGNIPDLTYKQQQEPSCIVRPSNSGYILCAFNDLRASDNPDVQGDSWIGFSMSSNTKTFSSGLVPGYKGHPNSLNMGFAADPSLVAIPGADPSKVGPNVEQQTPGLAILNYIGGFRDSSVGVLAIQRFVETEQEDQLPWLPEDEIYIVADGTSGRFIDKPAFLYVPADAGSQRTTSESIAVEGQANNVDVTTPTGTLIVAYAVFTGSNSIKVLIQRSKDNGVTWDNATKLSESQNEVTGVTLTAIGQRVVASWRRKADGNEGDAIISAFSSNTGKKWTKGEVMFDLCPFDQPATGVTFRTFAFPWAANDGNRFWTFATDRRYKTDGGDITSCDVTPGAPASIYEGVPRIVGMSSADGVNWVGASATEPFVLDSNLDPAGKPIGFQVMPSAFGTKGHIDIAWYDTRREAAAGLPGNNPVPLINDYWGAEGDADGNVTSLARVVRKADVWMTRLRVADTASCGTGSCIPQIEAPVRVSRYPVTFFGNTPFETEAHLPNRKLYASGTLAFKGDYIAIASPALRKNANGEWIPNHAACGAGDVSGECINKEDLFIAWGDNRDVRTDYNFLANTPPYNDGDQVPFTPPGVGNVTLGFKTGEKKTGSSEPLVDVTPEMAAVTESDDSTDPVFQNSEILTCSADSNFGRSRDANVYGAVIADAPSLIAPTPSKPLGSIQRTFPLVLNNPDLISSKNFCLQIANQPTNSLATGRASFLQLPSGLAESPSVQPLEYLPVSVPAGSSASRAVYVVAPQGSIVRVKAFEDSDDFQAQACLDLNDSSLPDAYTGTLQDTIAISDGNLFDSEYCSLPENANRPACVPPVEGDGEDETHNINLALANLQSPVLAAPISGALSLQNLNLQAPPLAALNFQNLNFQNLNFQNLNLQNLNFQNLNFQNLNLQNLNFQNLNFQNLNFQNLNLQNLNFQNLNLQNLNFQNLNLQNLNFQNLNLQNLNLQNLNLQNLNFQNLNLQAPALTGDAAGDTGETKISEAVSAGNPVFYQDITYIVETNANVATTYTSDIALNLDALKNNPEDPDEAVVQLIAWTPNEFNDGTDDCGSAVKFEAQVISAVTLKSSNLADVNLPTTFAPTNQNPYEGEVSFTSIPGQPVALTVRVWATQAAQAKLQTLYTEWEQCANTDISSCENEGLGGLISFGTSAQSCQTSDTLNPDGTGLNGETDCLNNGNEKIFQDREPPNVNPINPPDGFTPNDLPFELGATESELEITWPITGTDADPANLTFECFIDGDGPFYPNSDPVLGDDSFSVEFTYFFPAGTTPVSCEITDGNGNTTTAEFEVVVNDVTGPVITSPTAPVTANADPLTGTATVSYTVSALDAVAGPVTADCGPYSATGDTFPAGITSVTCTATDGTNGSSSSFDVVVSDVTGPVITSPTAPVTANADPLTGTAIVSYTVSALDAVAGPVTADCGPYSATGGTFPAGTTSVTCTATDGTNESSNSFDVVVSDVTGPVITVPATITVNADALTGKAIVSYDVSANDVVAGDVDANCSPVSGSAFSVGTTTVNCTATDGTTQSSASFDVIVNDITGPVITVPSTITASAGAFSNTANVNYTVSATDAVAGDVNAICTPASGSAFGIGTTTVNCTATDGTTPSNASFSVIVLDVTGPVITVPSTITVNADALTGTAIVTYTVSANDAVIGGVTASCTPTSGSAFNVGTTTVNCGATDGTNGSSNSFDVTVNDVTGPVITAPSDITVSADEDTGTATVNYTVSATDVIAGDVDAICTPASGATFSVGTTAVNCTATDGTTQSSASFNVTVNDVTGPVITADDREVRLDYVDSAYPIWGQVPVSFDYSANVLAEDAVDGTVAGVMCEPAPRNEPNPNPAVSGNLGADDFIYSDEPYVVNCSATDSSGQTGTATYNLTVNYLYDVNVIVGKTRVRLGSTIPFDWFYTDPDDPSIRVDSSGVDVGIRWDSTTNCDAVDGSGPNGEDSGSSDFRYSASDSIWQYSLQTKDLAKGKYLVSIVPPGVGVLSKSVCVTLR